MGISQSLPMTGYAKMFDIWMIFTISYPFIVITLHCLQKVALERKIIRINVESTGTGCLYKLLRINLVLGPLKCIKSIFNPVHVFLHFKSFCLVVLQLILASKLSELEQFEKRAENCLFADKIEFFGKWLHPRAKLKKADPT